MRPYLSSFLPHLVARPFPSLSLFAFVSFLSLFLSIFTYISLSFSLSLSFNCSFFSFSLAFSSLVRLLSLLSFACSLFSVLLALYGLLLCPCLSSHCFLSLSLFTLFPLSLSSHIQQPYALTPHWMDHFTPQDVKDIEHEGQKCKRAWERQRKCSQEKATLMSSFPGPSFCRIQKVTYLAH